MGITFKKVSNNNQLLLAPKIKLKPFCFVKFI